MKRIYQLLIVCFLIAFACASNAQNKIDDLRLAITKATSNEEKLQYLFALNDLALNADTMLPYIIDAEKITSVTPNTIDADKVRYCRAVYYTRKNHIDSALSIIDNLIDKYKRRSQHQDQYLNYLFFKAKILDRGNRYTQSLTQLYDVVEAAGQLKDTAILIQAKTGIGWVQMEMEQYNEALQWLYKALNTSTNKKFYKNYGALYSNIASTYNSLGRQDSAKFYINIGIKDARENDNVLYLATSLSIQAKIFIDSKEPHLAEAPLNEVVQIRKKMNDPFYTVYDMSSLASYYATNKQTDKGIALCKEGIDIAKKSGLSSQLLMIYHSLAENYKAAGNNVDYGNTLEAIIALKDSFNNINSSKLLADMQSATEAQKKENTILEQKFWLFGSAIFAVMTGIIVWLGFKQYNRKQNIKMQLALAEEKRIAAQSIIDAEEQERKRIAADLHDNIGAYASAIRADVEKITDNGFVKNEASLQNLQQHSQEIINSLRDTIWVLNKENITITGISDRIKNYAGKLQPTYSQIQFHITEVIKNDVRINSQNALNIFRIVQEAIHNALKHSAANNIIVDIKSEEQLAIKIIDDGKGITGNNKTDGNGLLNMKARAKEIGMQLVVSSTANEGTMLVLQSGTTN